MEIRTLTDCDHRFTQSTVAAFKADRVYSVTRVIAADLIRRGVAETVEKTKQTTAKVKE